MTDLCPSCREPLDYPSGDGCAAMTKHQPVKETPKIDWEAFGREIMEAWPEGVDGFDLQDIAVRHRVVVETKFDLAKHLDDHTDAWGVRQGDPWFVRNYR